VLAAGLGTRLRPLTEATPKPLLPVVGIPILGHTLAEFARLADPACEAIAVNLHYQGEQIRSHFGESFAGIPLTYSEEPVLLGTGGALGPLQEFFASADLILLVNGDSLCRWPLQRLLRAHLAGSAAATLLLTRKAEPADFGGGVGVDERGSVLSFRPGDPESGTVAHRRVFAGAHVLSPALLSRLRPGPSDIVRDLYSPLLAEGAPIASLATSRPWHDLGTPRRFLAATIDWAQGSGGQGRGSWVSPEAVLETGVKVSRSSIEAHARIEGGARIERSVLLPGAAVGKGSRLSEVILGPGAEIPPGSSIERRIVTRQLPGSPLNPEDSVVGSMVYTRF